MIKLRRVKDLGLSSREIDRLLDQMFFGRQAGFWSDGRTWSPQMDICETPDSYVVTAEVPGAPPDSIEVVVNQNHLLISGRRPEPRRPGCMQIHQSEINYGDFKRLFKLPSLIRPDEVVAALENGLLVITLPKELPVNSRVEIE